MERTKAVRGLAAALGIGLGLRAAPPSRSASVTPSRALGRQARHVRAAGAELEAARERLAQGRLAPTNPILSSELARHTGPGEAQLDRGVVLAQYSRWEGSAGSAARAPATTWRAPSTSLPSGAACSEGEVRRSFSALAARSRPRVPRLPPASARPPAAAGGRRFGERGREPTRSA